MKKLIVVLISVIALNSSYAMNRTFYHNAGFICDVTGADITYSEKDIVHLSIPLSSAEFGSLSGNINAHKVSIEIEEGLEHYVLKYVRITADCLEINRKEYLPHGAFAQKGDTTLLSWDDLMAK